jgi:uroporphyrinogen-III synthase
MWDYIMPANNVHPSLQGIRVALTVAADDPYSPADQVRDLEGSVLFYPVAQILPLDDYAEVDAALQRCRQGEIDWLLLTTPRVVEAVADRIAQLGLNPAEMAQLKIATYGARARLVLADRIPAWQSMLPFATTHQELLDAMALGAGDKVLLPLALHTHADWPRLLEATPAETIVAPAYRLLLGRDGDDVPAFLWAGLVDVVVFLTENSVRHFVTRLKEEGGTLDMLSDVPVAALDPQTAAAAQAYDLQVKVVPTEHTPAALADALAHYFSAVVAI